MCNKITKRSQIKSALIWIIGIVRTERVKYQNSKRTCARDNTWTELSAIKRVLSKNEILTHIHHMQIDVDINGHCI